MHARALIECQGGTQREDEMSKWSVTWEEIDRVMDRGVRLHEGSGVYPSHGDLRTYLSKVPKRYRMGAALALAVSKWRPGTRRRGEGSCGLCALWAMRRTDDEKKRNVTCKKSCPLSRAGHWCDVQGSLWRRADGSDAATDQLYAVLCGLYEAEFKRVCGDGVDATRG
jgi:hypothetical protein